MLDHEPTNGEPNPAPASSSDTAGAEENAPVKAPRKVAAKRAPRKSTKAAAKTAAAKAAPADEPAQADPTAEAKPKRRTTKKAASPAVEAQTTEPQTIDAGGAETSEAPPKKAAKRTRKATQLTLSHQAADAPTTEEAPRVPALSAPAAAPPIALFVAPEDVPTVARKKPARAAKKDQGDAQQDNGSHDNRSGNTDQQSADKQPEDRPSGNTQNAEQSKAEKPKNGQDDTSDSDNDDGSRRRRRGRRGRGKGRDDETNGEDPGSSESSAKEQSDESGTDSSKQESRQQDSARNEQDTDKSGSGRSENGKSEGSSEDSSDDEGSGTRRRRRRRRRGDDSDDSSSGDNGGGRSVVSARSNDSNKVRGVSGSVRLEAKRQRRREGRDAGRRRAPILTEAEFLARREAVTRSMIVRQSGERIQIAVLEDDVLVEHYVTLASEQSFAGGIYYGRVQNVLPSMEAAFIDIGKKRNAVLYAGEVNWDAAGLEGKQRTIEHALSSGDKVLVQVTKDPIGHKGARLTSQISLPGRYLVYVPGGSMTGISRKLPEGERHRLKDILRKIVPDGAGVIVRTAAEGATEEELTRDVNRLMAQWEVIEKKVANNSTPAPSVLHEEPDLAIRVVRDLFNEDFESMVVAGDDAWDTISAYINHVAPDLSPRLSKYVGAGEVFHDHRIDEQLSKALDRKVWLPSGGSLVIDHTEAMTVIDVNTGKFTGSGGNLEQTVTKNNLEAAEEVVRQLRLRDVGGIVVIDFIDMLLESNRDLVLRRLTECLGRDRTKHQVAEVTSLGLVQMTRKRVGQGLLDAFSEPCEHCGGRGVVVHAEPVDKSHLDKSGDNDKSRGGSDNNKSRGGSDNNKSRRGRDRSRNKSDDKQATQSEPEAEPKHDASALISEIANASKRKPDANATPPAGEIVQTDSVAETPQATETVQTTETPRVAETVQVTETAQGEPTVEASSEQAAEPLKPTPRRRRAARRPAGSPHVAAD
ncbi:ribonuclease E [Antricoccus suffuscus]|uniref:Ribonuclease E n=2 Tax=Antricoccus suffuscus TaxID=1629062 RepID=A0A2T0ZVL4_9ACTN|nr:ribonuclease E [Antricoccus suffuscus]